MDDMHWLGFDDETYLRVADIEGWGRNTSRYKDETRVIGTRVYMRSGNWIDIDVKPEEFTEVFTNYLEELGVLPTLQ